MLQRGCVVQCCPVLHRDCVVLYCHLLHRDCVSLCCPVLQKDRFTLCCPMPQRYCVQPYLALSYYTLARFAPVMPSVALCHPVPPCDVICSLYRLVLVCDSYNFPELLCYLPLLFAIFVPLRIKSYYTGQ